MAKHIKSKKHLANGPKLIICNCCNYIAPSHQALYNHKQRKHKENSLTKYYFHCSTCNVSIRDKCNIDIHIQSNKHKENIIQHHREFLIDSMLTKRRIDTDKKYDLIIKQTNNKIKTHIKKDIKKDKFNENTCEYSLDILQDTDKHYQINVSDINNIIDYLIAKSNNYNDEFDYDDFYNDYKNNKLSLDDKYVFIRLMAICL